MNVLKSHLKQLISTRKILFKKYLSGIDFSENTTSLDQEFILNVLNYINKNISDNNFSTIFSKEENESLRNNELSINPDINNSSFTVG